MTKKVTIVVVILALLCVAGLMGVSKVYGPAEPKFDAGNPPFSFIAAGATQATTTVGNYLWTTVLAADSTKGYAAICNNADSGVNVNNPVYLGFAATSTKPYGFRLASGDCYEMNSDNLFYGTVYAIASTSTTTVTTISARNY